MEEIKVSDWDELQEQLQSSRFDRSTTVFRGVSNVHDHKLRPKIGRAIDGHEPYSERREKWLYERFKQFSALHWTVRLEDPWEIIALADRAAVLESLNIGEAAVIAAVASALLSIGVVAALAAALAPLIVKRFIWPAKDELCAAWAEAIKRSG